MVFSRIFLDLIPSSDSHQIASWSTWGRYLSRKKNWKGSLQNYFYWNELCSFACRFLLYSYAAVLFWKTFWKHKDKKLAQFFSFHFSIYCSVTFQTLSLVTIYLSHPPELEIKDTTESANCTWSLNLLLETDNK